MVMNDNDETDQDSELWPNGENILRAMEWLVADSEGAALVFHYSGHGGQCDDPGMHVLILAAVKFASIQSRICANLARC